jgi:hypothetical protein
LLLSLFKAVVSTLPHQGLLAVSVATAVSLGFDMGSLATPYIKDFVSCCVHTVDASPGGLAFSFIYFCCIYFYPTLVFYHFSQCLFLERPLVINTT